MLQRKLKILIFFIKKKNKTKHKSNILLYFLKYILKLKRDQSPSEIEIYSDPVLIHPTSKLSFAVDLEGEVFMI